MFFPDSKDFLSDGRESEQGKEGLLGIGKMIDFPCSLRNLSARNIKDGVECPKNTQHRLDRRNYQALYTALKISVAHKTCFLSCKTDGKRV